MFLQKQPLEVLCKYGVFKNFAKFNGKHLCQSLFNKLVGLRPASVLTKRLRHKCFPVNFAKFLRTLPVAASALTILYFMCFVFHILINLVERT